jgi:hypothetical protein
MFRKLSRGLRVLVLYAGIAFLTEVISFILVRQGIKTLFISHIFTVIEFAFLVLIFSLWQKNRMLSLILRATIPINTFVVFMGLLFEGATHFNSFSGPLANLVLVAASAHTLFELNKEEHYVSVWRLPQFWVSSGVLVYYASTLVVFSLTNVLIQDLELLKTVFLAHAVINSVTNLVYTGGFLCQLPAQKFGGL